MNNNYSLARQKRRSILTIISFSWFVFGLITLLASSTQAQVSGTIFRDYNANGIKDNANEPGVASLTVTATFNGTVATAISTTAGSYSFSAAQIPSTTKVRLEFSGIAPGDFSGPFSAATGGSGTSVQFVTAGTTTGVNINFGVNYPGEYCQTSPRLVTACFVNGAVNNGQTPAEVMVSFNYLASGNAAAVTYEATKTQTGFVWGLAYSKQTRKIYSATFLKRHVGVKGNLGDIYVTDAGGSSDGALFTTIPDAGTIASDAARGIATITSQSPDAEAFSKVGRAGLGGISISDDGTTLYTVNLNDKKLYTIDIATKNQTSVAIPTICDLTKGQQVPFAVKMWRGNVYVGVVCDASVSKSRADLKANVLVYDPTTQTFGASPVLTVNLDYLKGAAFSNAAFTYLGQSAASLSNKWYPWTDTYSATELFPLTVSGSTTENISHPTPILSDLEFDRNGNMILGFMDRMGHQIGYANRNPLNTANEDVVIGGDILKAYYQSGTSWQIEPTIASGGEFFTGEAFTTDHTETSQGGIYYSAPDNLVALVAIDPLTYATGGVIYLSNSTGAQTQTGLQLYSSSNNTPTYFSKANGLGDITALCNPAPIEIGNRVWKDDNRNGIQDPTEAGIPGAVITLYDATKTTAIASVTTNAAGQYYFSSTTITTGNSSSAVATTALTYNTTYALVITSLGTGTAASGLTLTDVTITPGESGTQNTGLTTINNDAVVDAGKPCIKLTTGGPGEINHTYDFGIVKNICSLTVTAQASSQTICTGLPVTLAAQVSPAGSYTYAWSAPAGVTLTGANTATATATASVAGLQTFTVTVSNSPTCFTTTTVSVSAVDCTTYLEIAVVNPGTCLSATNGYTSTGVISLTNAIDGTATITDGLVTTTVSIGAGTTSVPYSLTGLTSGTSVHTVTVSYASLTASTTYTAPASCTVTPCGLALVVTPGLCQPATNDYVLSGSITATNVPTSGTLTITSSAFSPRSLTLPAGNASGTFSYSGLVANGQVYTLSVTYSDGACAPGSQTFTAPVSCSAAPVCSLSATATAGICATATNTYSASVVISLANAPAGMLSVILPGSAPVSQTLAANTGSITIIFQDLPSDGASHTATISLPGCGTTTATFTAPGSCSAAPVCSVSAVATPGLCLSATNTFTTVAVITLTNPTVGVLTITDGPASQTFATTDVRVASFTATFANVPSDGSSRTITASLAGCSTTSTTYTAPASCSVEPICSLSATATAGLCATATNTYSATVVVALVNAPAGTLTISLPGSAPISQTLAANAGSVTIVLPDLLSDGASHTTTISLPGCGTTSATFTAPASCSVAPVCSISAVVTPGLCLTATNTYSATAVVTVINPAAGETVTVSTGGQTLTFSTTALSQNTFTANFNGLISDGASHVVTVSLPGCGSANTTYTAPVSCSTAPVCSISAVATPGLCATATNTFSTTVLVTLTNPTAGTLTVTDGVRSITFAVSATLGTVTAPAVFNGIESDGGLHTITVSLPGCASTTLTYTAPVSCTTATPLGSIGDFVWYDLNKDGQQDAGETGVDGVSVRLLQETTPGSYSVVSTTVTSGSGAYLFPNLPAGTYVVEFVTSTLPINFVLTTANATGVATGLNSDANPATGRSGSIVLVPTNPALRDILTIDAGIISTDCVAPAKCLPIVITRIR